MVEFFRVLSETKIITLAFGAGVLCIVIAIIGRFKAVIEPDLEKPTRKILALFGGALLVFSMIGTFVSSRNPASAVSNNVVPTSRVTDTAIVVPGALPTDTSTVQQPSILPTATSLIANPSPFPGTTVQLTLPNGSIKNIVVNPKVGEIHRLLEINQQEGAAGLLVEVPIGWDVLLPDPLPENWNAYQLPDLGSPPCTDWPNRYDAASMQSEVNGGTAIVFAEKEGSRILLPLTGIQSFPILGDLLRTNEDEHQGPLNASIQIFLVPEGITGRASVYKGWDFTGNQCTLVFD
jgi:hypothetical protein